MRTSGWFAAFLVAGCSAPNPVFEVAPGEASGVDATTAVTTTQGTTAESVGSISASMSDASITGSSADPSSVTSGESGTSSGVEPITSTGVEPGTSTGSGSSTGEMQCALHLDLDFDEFLRVGGKIVDKCFGGPFYLHGKLLAGEQELRFNTSGTGCPSEEGFGVFSLGQGYSLPVPEDGACAKLYIYPDGPAPFCNIGRFFIIQDDNQAALAIGSFSSADGIAPVKELVMPSVELLPCCPVESQNCCMDNYGDFALVVGGVAVNPGQVAPVPVEGGMASLANIQNWQTGDCQLQVTITRRDWAAVRL